MITGAFDGNRPLISLIVGWQLEVVEIVALIDTGFTGELKLSPARASKLGLQITHTESVTLADEKSVNMPAGLAQVAMEGITDTVSVLIGEGTPIIGVGLLRKFGYNLNIDFKTDSIILKR